MEREALKLALEALQFALHVGFPESNESQIKKGEKAYQQHRVAIASIKAALAQPEQEPEMLTIAYQSGYYDGKQAALAGREWNFCERCGKRTADIHTCTPPQGDA
jgi:hypothetical protein